MAKLPNNSPHKRPDLTAKKSDQMTAPKLTGAGEFDGLMDAINKAVMGESGNAALSSGDGESGGVEQLLRQLVANTGEILDLMRAQSAEETEAHDG